MAPIIDERYEKAAAMGLPRLLGLMRNRTVAPHWSGDGMSFWYRRDTDDGHEFVQVALPDGSRERAFDHARLARSLGAYLGVEIAENRLPVTDIRRADPATLDVRLEDGRWVVVTAEGGVRPGPEPASAGLLSNAEGTHGVFCRDTDLWLRVLATGEERRLTTSGQSAFAGASCRKTTT